MYMNSYNIAEKGKKLYFKIIKTNIIHNIMSIIQKICL